MIRNLNELLALPSIAGDVWLMERCGVAVQENYRIVQSESCRSKVMRAISKAKLGDNEVYIIYRGELGSGIFRVSSDVDTARAMDILFSAQK